MLEEFLLYLESKNYSKETIKRYSREINYFQNYIKKNYRLVEKKDILHYQNSLYKKKTLSRSTQKGMLTSLSTYFKFLYQKELVHSNPMDDITRKVIAPKKIRKVLKPREMFNFIDSIDGMTIYRIRDRAIFELMYGTGLRASEACNLNLTHVDLKSNTLLVFQGKGKKDRMVPLGRTVVSALSHYLKIRHRFLARAETDKQAFFFSSRGNRLERNALNFLLKKYLKNAEINSDGISPHTIRHSFASHMLNGGADINEIKDILGHKSLETTVIYTELSADKNKAMIRKFHPRENAIYDDGSNISLEQILALPE